jgi:hypothetical protein
MEEITLEEAIKLTEEMKADLVKGLAANIVPHEHRQLLRQTFKEMIKLIDKHNYKENNNEF